MGDGSAKWETKNKPRGNELPLYDIVCDGRALVVPSVKVCQCLKPPLLIADAHECLAVDDKGTRLDAVVFAEVDLIHVDLP